MQITSKLGQSPYTPVTDPGGLGIEDLLRQVVSPDLYQQWVGARDEHAFAAAAGALATELARVLEDLYQRSDALKGALHTHTGKRGYALDEGDTPRDDDLEGQVLRQSWLALLDEQGDVYQAMTTLRHIRNTGGKARMVEKGTVGEYAAQLIELFDTNGDGDLSVFEDRYYGMYSSASGANTANGAALIASANRDGDGVASGDEIRALVASFDQDRDGKLDDGERAAFEASGAAPEWTHHRGVVEPVPPGRPPQRPPGWQELAADPG